MRYINPRVTLTLTFRGNKTTLDRATHFRGLLFTVYIRMLLRLSDAKPAFVY